MTKRFQLAVVLFCFLAAPVQAQQTSVPETLAAREKQVLATLERVKPSVVAITDGVGWGSGVIVSEDGLVLTAAHVTQHRRRLRVVMPDGRQVRARALGRSLANDAGMLQLPKRDQGAWPAVELGTTKNLKRGTWAIVLGHPGGLEPDRPAPVRLGRILSVGSRTVVTDGTIVVGDSGGPLFDLDGKLIGIHSMIGTDIYNNRHVTIDAFKRDWPRLEDGETWGELGDFDTNLAKSRMLGVDLVWDRFVPKVKSVTSDSPAARAGIKAGDTLRKLDNQAIADPLELSLILGELRPGQKVFAELSRKTGELRVPLTVGARPQHAVDDEQLVTHTVSGPGRFEKAGRQSLSEFAPVARSARASVLKLFGRKPKRRVSDNPGDRRRRQTEQYETKSAQVALATVITSDGYLATKYSEVRATKDLRCELPNGDRVIPRIVKYDVNYDIAVLRVKASGLSPVRWQTKVMKPGMFVATPGRGRLPLASGVVSVNERSLKSTEMAFLGVSVSRLDDRRIPQGALVSEVIGGSAAERAGLKQNDVVLRINDRLITGAQNLIERISSFKPGDKVRIEYQRNNVIRTLTAVLSGRFVAGDWRLEFERRNLIGTPISEHSTGFPVVLQHDSVLLPNQCGGPLLDLQGRAIGMNIARAGRVMSYAIPADHAERVIRRLMSENG